MLNDRQLASLIWVGLVAAFCIGMPSIRPAAARVVRAFLDRKIWPVFVVLGAWSVGLVYIGDRVGLWIPALAADTWFWFFTSAVVLLFNFAQASDEPDYFIRSAKKILGLTVLLGFLSDLYVLWLPVEFLGQGFIALLAMLSAVAASDPRFASVRKICDGCVQVLGVALLILASIKLITMWSVDAAPGLGRQLLLPVWLTLGVLPLIYTIALLAAYEHVFVRVDWRNSRGRAARLRSKIGIILGLHGRATLVGKFVGEWPEKAANATSLRAVLRLTQDYQDERRVAERASRDAADRLIRHTGSDDVDAAGLRLDRREFTETTDALRWIATCQMGWGRRESGYRSDILDVVGDLNRHGLSGDGHIVVELSADGASWKAWRRTITGWVFAIGAAGPPPDQWLYDGPEPPLGFPGSSPDWGASPFETNAGPNWSRNCLS